MRQRQEYDICKSLSGWKLPYQFIIFPRTVVGKTDRAAKRILIIVCQDRRHLCVRPVKRLGNTLRVAGKRVSQKRFGRFQDAHHIRPAADTHGIFKFHDDLLVGNKRLLRFCVISKIAQMDQQRQHVILDLEILHVILEA